MNKVYSMDDRYTLLCARIWRHCEARHWYGPDGGLEEDRAFRDANGDLHIQPITHDARAGFEFAPASPEHLDVTEARLGYPLPPLLRRLYVDVANGGFGPGEGITGAHGGYWYGWDGHFFRNDQPWTPPWPWHPLDLAAYIQQHSLLDRFTLPNGTWPARFLHLCYWGCATDTFLDANTDRVYVVEDITNRTVRLMLDAKSFEEWIERWLNGERPAWWPDVTAGDVET